MLGAVPLFLHVFIVWWLIKHLDNFNFIITPTHFLSSEHGPVFLFDGFNSAALFFILNKSKSSVQCNSCNTIKNGVICWLKLEPPQNITKHTILKLHTHSGTFKDEMKHNSIRQKQNLQNHGHSWDSTVPIIMLLCIPIRPTEEVQVQLHLFLTSAPIGVEWSPCAPPTAVPLGKEPSIPNGCSLRSWKLLSWSQNCHVDPVVYRQPESSNLHTLFLYSPFKY